MTTGTRSDIEPTLTVPQAMAVEAALTLRLFRLQTAAASLASDPFALVVNQYAQRDSGAALAAVREALYGDPSGPEPDEPTWDLADTDPIDSYKAARDRGIGYHQFQAE